MKLWPSSTDSLHSTRRATAAKNPTTEAPAEGSSRPLRLRLLFWIVLALTPAAFVSVLQGVDRVQRDVADLRERLIQTARATASDEENVVASAEQILRAMANQPEVRNGDLNCGQSLSSALKGLAYFVNLTRVGADGRILCAAVLPPQPFTVTDRAWWPEAKSREGFFVTAQVVSPTARRPVIGGVLPLRGKDGTFDGVLGIGMDVQWLDYMLHVQKVPQGAVVAIFDTAGTIIASNNMNIATVVFRKRTPITDDNDALATGIGPRNESWSYAMVPLTGSTALLGFAMRNMDIYSGTYLSVATDLLLPFLMLSLASAAIWIATDRQVVRWIVYMRRIAGAYRRGHYAIRPVALDGAPSEFRLLGETISGMAEAVQDRDRRLRDAVAQKTLLIKETHHRVKNNLQIVMSLLSLQAAQLRDPAAQTALRQTQARVNALALVHRILHEIEDQGSVDLQRLMQDLAHQVHEGFGADGRDLRLELEIASRQASGDLAVPLTLFTVEALTNAFKYAYPPDSGSGLIRVSLGVPEKGRLELAIEDDGVGFDAEHVSSGIGTRLMQAFAQQVGGTMRSLPREGGGTRVSLNFPDSRFGVRKANF